MNRAYGVEGAIKRSRRTFKAGPEAREIGHNEFQELLSIEGAALVIQDISESKKLEQDFEDKLSSPISRGVELEDRAQ